jgi:parallel beta-helix repeat protein
VYKRQGFGINSVFLNSPHRGRMERNEITGNGTVPGSTGLNISTPIYLRIGENRISGLGTGMVLSHYSIDSVLELNIIENNLRNGISIQNAKDYEVLNNLIFNNTEFGIKCRSSSDCLISNNTLIENAGSGDSFNSLKIQGSDDSNLNMWNDSKGGNYWGDWTTPDNDGDGIVDLPYLIYGTTSYDQKPLAEPSFTYLSAPGEFSLSAMKDTIYLQWQNPDFDLDDSLQGFRLHRSGGPGPDLELDLGSDVLSYSDEDIIDGTVYRYHIRGINTYGKGRSSEVLEGFTDSIPPHIEYISPANGSVVTDRDVEIRWNVTDNIELSKVELSSDMIHWEDMGTNDTYQALNLSEGKNSFHLRAFDTHGNNRTESIEFTVDVTDPDLEIISPENGTITNASIVMIFWQGNDSVTDIMGYRIRIDEGAWRDLGLNISHTASLSFEGGHRIEIEARDTGGNTVIRELEIVLDSTEPDVFFTFPAEGYNTTDRSFEVKWAAYDSGSAIAGFNLSVDGSSPLDLAPSTTGFVLDSLSVGEHTIELTAYDNAGNFKEVQVHFQVLEKDLEPTTTIIKGMVLDGDGNPIHKAKVTADTGVATDTGSTGRDAVGRGQ